MNRKSAAKAADFFNYQTARFDVIFILKMVLCLERRSQSSFIF